MAEAVSTSSTSQRYDSYWPSKKEYSTSALEDDLALSQDAFTLDEEHDAASAVLEDDDDKVVEKDPDNHHDNDDDEARGSADDTPAAAGDDNVKPTKVTVMPPPTEVTTTKSTQEDEALASATASWKRANSKHASLTRESSVLIHPKMCSVRKCFYKHHVVKTSRMPWYIPPRQRHRWGDLQTRPHTNWGDVFLDLFYVAAAYNLGNLLRLSPTRTGLLYLAGCFLPIQGFWMNRAIFNARFEVQHDICHQLFQVAIMLLIGTAVVFVRPVLLLRQPAEYVDMFAFSISLALATLLCLVRLIEIMICQLLQQRRYNMERQGQENSGHSQRSNNNHNNDDAAAAGIQEHEEDYQDGDSTYGDYESDSEESDSRHETKFSLSLHPEAFDTARGDFLPLFVSFLFYSAAAAYAGQEYFSQHDNNKSNSSANEYDTSLASAVNTTTTTTTEGSSTTSGDNVAANDAHRVLAAAETTTSANLQADSGDDTAIWLCLAGALSSVVYFLLANICFFGRNRFDLKKHRVPINVDYMIHRYGEWTMLMLGESVLSLLIVDLEPEYRYYKTFFSGCVTIILLQYLHFQSQPHDPNHHAMRRSMKAGISFWFLMQLHSVALVVLGTSYKMFLYEYVYEAASANSSSNSDTHRRTRTLLSMLANRFLAGGGGGESSYMDATARQERIAHFFSGSLALVWFCTDAMLVTHHGLDDLLGRCKRNKSGNNIDCQARTRRRIMVAVGLTSCRVGLIVYIATLSQYEHRPDVLAGIGMGGMMAQLLLRIVGDLFFQMDHVDEVISRILHRQASIELTG